MTGVVLVVLIVARGNSAQSNGTFERALRAALGSEARVEIEQVASDPADDESAARAHALDGVVELSWSEDGSRARLHSYLSHEQRWVDREIGFGSAVSRSSREESERQRLLGLAIATMFSTQESDIPPPQPAARIPPQPEASVRFVPTPLNSARRGLEFAGIMSSGIGGTGGGLGATGGLRVALADPVWLRVFVAARAGNIPAAQATTRSVNVGAGVAVATSRRNRPLSVGLRVDGFASYFDATHLSEDDVNPDRRSRWLPGADLLVEGGFRLAGNAELALSAGLETVFGKTEIYTHGQVVGVVPPVRAVAEAGFRIGF